MIVPVARSVATIGPPRGRVRWVKMLLPGLILALEVYPMVTLIRWRIAAARGRSLDLSTAPAIARISFVQIVLLLGMVFAATAMARGLSY